MAAPDTPAETFKRALGHAARALAEQPELEVAFGSDGPRVAGGVLTLPHPPRDPSGPESAALRGQADRLDDGRGAGLKPGRSISISSFFKRHPFDHVTTSLIRWHIV